MLCVPNTARHSRSAMQMTYTSLRTLSIFHAHTFFSIKSLIYIYSQLSILFYMQLITIVLYPPQPGSYSMNNVCVPYHTRLNNQSISGCHSQLHICNSFRTTTQEVMKPLHNWRKISHILISVVEDVFSEHPFPLACHWQHNPWYLMIKLMPFLCSKEVPVFRQGPS
jgi:hypothetical protein